LFDRAAGYDYDTVKVFHGDDAKPVVSDYFIEHIPPDIGAIKLWLLNRRPDRWREKVEVANTGGLIDRTPDEINANEEFSSAVQLGKKVADDRVEQVYRAVQS
jgi:hypothetical protein